MEAIAKQVFTAEFRAEAVKLVIDQGLTKRLASTATSLPARARTTHRPNVLLDILSRRPTSLGSVALTQNLKD